MLHQAEEPNPQVTVLSLQEAGPCSALCLYEYYIFYRTEVQRSPHSSVIKSDARSESGGLLARHHVETNPLGSRVHIWKHPGLKAKCEPLATSSGSDV